LPEKEMLGPFSPGAGAAAGRPSPIRGKVQLLNRLERIDYSWHELAGESGCLPSN
jgi:hypothetical protein